MKRIVLYALGALLALAVLVYAVDCLTWRVRGSAMDRVEVSRVSVASLKNKKEEYYSEGTDVLPCAATLLPPPTSNGWLTPCWWLRRHRNVEIRY